MSFVFPPCMTPDYWLPPSTPPPLLSCPVLSYPKLSWAAQPARLCVTPCQVLLEAVRWQPPSLSAAPCPLRGWGGAIALHPRAPQRCDRKAWLAVTRPSCGGTQLRREQKRKREGYPGGVRAAPRGCYFIYPAGPQEWAGGGGGQICVCMCASQVWAWPILGYSVGTYYIHGTVTAMALDEAGWTCRGKGGVEHLSERRLLLPSSPVELTQQPVEHRLLHDGRSNCEFDFFPSLTNI